jgi:hypothetical protein
MSRITVSEYERLKAIHARTLDALAFAKADTDKALAALREIAERRLHSTGDIYESYANVCEIARAAIAEIEGEA